MGCNVAVADSESALKQLDPHWRVEAKFQFVVLYGTHNLVGVVMVVVVIVAMIIPVMVVVVFVRPISLMHVPTIGIVVPVWMHIVGALIRRTVPVSGVPAVTPLERLPVTL